MAFLLSSQNVFEYLIELGLCIQEDQAQSKIERKSAKNFNLLVSLPSERQLLIKQELHNREGKTLGEFSKEWRVQKFLQLFPELDYIRPWLSEAIHFDAANSIIVFNYLNNYRDLADFYNQEKSFPTEIAKTIGSILAAIHRVTLEHQDYRDYFWENAEATDSNQKPNLNSDLERITPEIFGQVPADGLKFFALYQRYDSLGQATAELINALKPCCLTHNDLKLNNILLSNDWQQAIAQGKRSANNMVRLIDWERSSWGDPAFDLGMLIASYLQIWLFSLVTSKAIPIEESLRLATTPLEVIQPSLAALTATYLSNFPEILERRPDFLVRVMQFSGLALIQTIQSMIQYQKSFGNSGICVLQVAKTLLCRPHQSIPIVFGMKASELTHLTTALA